MSDYIDVKIDVFEHTDQRARILESLTPALLIQEILKEFDDITADAPEKYAIYLKGMERPLNPASTMVQLDIQPQDTLVFDYVRKTIRRMLQPSQYAFLREETTGKTYDIQWQPAVIGRPTNEADHDIILAVNVQLLPAGMTISRKHAEITFSDGKYFIEMLAENNLLQLNGKDIPLNNKREIKNNDRLFIGRHKITMVFETQKLSPPTAEDARSQAGRRGTQPSPTLVTAPSARGVSTSPERHTAVPPPGQVPLSYLVLEKCTAGENLGQKLILTEYPFVLGRSLPLLSDEKETSRKHAEISYEPGRQKFYITDLNSTNGVTLDGIPIKPEQPAEIKPGVRLGLGQVVIFRFEL